MASFTFIVNGQNFELIEDEAHASGSVRYLDASFSFDERWEGLRKFLIFEKGSESHKIEIVNNRIHAEAGIYLEDGPWKVSVIGETVIDDNLVKRITTIPQRTVLKKSGMPNGDPFPEVTPSIGEQIVNRAAEEADRAQGIADDLPSMVNDYVAEHKEELKGTDGYTPVKGIDYTDGYTPVKGIDYNDGYTPVKGVDYFDGKDADPYDDTEIRKEVKELNDGLAKKIERFEVEYGVTTASEIEKAISEGKDIVGHRDGYEFRLSLVNTEYILLTVSASYVSETIRYMVLRKSDSRWFTGNAKYENSSYRVNDINGNESATNRYPSTKAVADYVADKTKEKEWVLKGTLTTENKASGVNADLTGCNEVLLKGYVTGSGNTNLTSNDRTLIFNFVANAERVFLAMFKNMDGYYDCTSAKYGTPKTSTTLNYTYTNATAQLNRSIESIRAFKFGNSDLVTDCNIEIYAR